MHNDVARVNSPAIAAILLAGLLPLAARATTIPLPTSRYVNGTNLVPFADPDEALLNSISNGILTINFSSPMRASTVGDNWASWRAWTRTMGSIFGSYPGVRPKTSTPITDSF
jgi:hypothetical protein